MSDAGPVFAVVGHPNKGKSSLVSAMAQDASIAIGPEPGTTVRARHYPMRLDGRTLYTLVDTPGFQRPRAALDWMRRHAGSADRRAEAVARFVAEHRDDPRFSAECELLSPIVAGAGILYVVDGAVPYTPEYDAEMEILRWTGRPSIALINPIGRADHEEDWSRALGQYFRVVRVLDALDAPFDRRLQMLSAFGELSEEWRAPLSLAVAALRAEREHALRESARAVADLVAQALDLVVEKRVPRDGDATALRPELERRWREKLRALEQRCRDRVQDLYRHERLERREPELDAAEGDLFSQDTWLLFGLRRGDLARTGAAGGALAGLGVDAALGGGSLMLGAAVGAVLGAAGGWFSGGALADLSVRHLPLGQRVARYGPSRSPNLPFVLVGRARVHHRALAGRTHARREALDLETPGALNPLTDAEREALAGAFRTLGRSEPGTRERAAALDRLTDALRDLLQD